MTTPHPRRDTQTPSDTEAGRRSQPTSTEQDLVDIRDMIVVHTAMLREFRLAPALVASAAPGDRSRIRQIDQHLELICDLMHHHHTGEDELLWPVLEPRLTPTENVQVAAAEAQHAGLDRALTDAVSARARWTHATGVIDATAARDELVGALNRLHRLLAEHLEHEERHLLPLAASHLTDGEWHAIGAAGARSIAKRQMLLVLGMFAYEGDPAVLALMLGDAPAPVRALLPRIAARTYARYARRLYGTPRP